ncbi:MAG: tRNA lysidine(34) synthetase TilS [Rikenellaceae bacterium]
MGTTLQQNLTKYIEREKLLSAGDKVLLTVSGGVDSMVLLDLFAQSEYEIGVAHCNFQLRGQESMEDEVLVEQLAKKHGVPFYNRRFETKEEMERTGESMEMAARRLRYAWFQELSQEHGYNIIAIAHHADDSIETFFINLLRGTGLRGLTGISVHIGRIIRPLMFASRKDILEYAMAANIEYREDSSNRSTKYLRNKIRLGLVPRIREINAKFTDLMRGNISRLTDAQLFIDSCIKRISSEVITEQDGIFTLHIDRIESSLPQNFVVYELLSSKFGFKGDVIEALMRSLEEGSSGRQFYAKEYVAYSDRGDILVAKILDSDLCESTIEEGMQRAYCGNSVLYLEKIDIDLIEQLKVAENIALIDADKLHFPLTLRRWQDGDWFIPYGMEGRKKVSDFLIDTKVSRPEKQRQFLLMSGDDIVWVIGRRIDDRYALDGESENVLRITKEIL